MTLDDKRHFFSNIQMLMVSYLDPTNQQKQERSN